MAEESSKMVAEKPKKFLNEPANAVEEFIEGLLLTYPNKLQRLENHHVVLAKPLNESQKVHILSGGGSGHEPSHAGWIGDGMLSGAILGGIFASPSVSSILAAIRSVTQIGSACLLIVKNYTGDRLNFGMACELANAENRPCEMVIVADDCAIPRSKGETGARGVAGTVLVHKAAGAAAAKGMTLQEVACIAMRVASRIGSLGVALDAVSLPGAATINSRLAGNKMEIGLGIHGEAGIRQSPLLTSKEIAKEIVDTIHQFGFKPYQSSSGDELHKIQEGQNLILLVNNLGGTSNFEIFILARDLIRYMESSLQCKVSRAFVGSFMTSFNMHGASASILCLGEQENDLAALIDAPTDAPAWIKADVLQSENHGSVSVLPEILVDKDKYYSKESTTAIHKFGQRAKTCILAACKALMDAESQLTEWDTIVGDGDCGLTMARGAMQVHNDVLDQVIDVDSPCLLFKGLADSVSKSMGGTSGILFEIMLRRASTLLADHVVVDENSLTCAFIGAVRAGSYYGGAKLGYRTMMDALLPAAEACEAGVDFIGIANAACKGAYSTANMTSALAGRSNYLSEEQIKGTPDPGAKAVAIILSAAANAL